LTVVTLLVSVTISPADPAGPFRVTVPVEIFPPITVAGDNVTDAIARGFNVRVAVLDEAPKVAVIVSAVAVETAEV